MMDTALIETNRENIGFRLGEDNKVKLVLPKFINAGPDTKELREKEYFSFYKLFKKYSREKKDQKSIKSEDNFRTLTGFTSIDEKAISVIELYFTLLDDYKNNGLLLFNKRNTNIKPKGCINWSRTIKQSPLLVMQDAIIYDNPFFNNISFELQHPVTVLHACALMKMSRLFEMHVSIPFDFRFLKSIETSDKLISSILRRYKREMFSDRNKKIFTLLEKIFTDHKLQNALQDNNEKLNYVENFNTLWEQMLKTSLFDEVKAFQELLPVGKFYLEDQFNREMDFRGIKSFIDLIITHNFQGQDYLFILDAKNYLPNFIAGGGMPQTGDIIKQLFYKYFLSQEFHEGHKYKLGNIINAFVLPYDSGGEEVIRYMGCHSFNSPFADKNIGKVLCFQVDFYQLRNNYLNPKKEYREKIVDFIAGKYLETCIHHSENTLEVELLHGT